jgi:hypothetical protein
MTNARAACHFAVAVYSGRPRAAADSSNRHNIGIQKPQLRDSGFDIRHSFVI